VRKQPFDLPGQSVHSEQALFVKCTLHSTGLPGCSNSEFLNTGYAKTGQAQDGGPDILRWMDGQTAADSSTSIDDSDSFRYTASEQPYPTQYQQQHQFTNGYIGHGANQSRNPQAEDAGKAGSSSIHPYNRSWEVQAPSLQPASSPKDGVTDTQIRHQQQQRQLKWTYSVEAFQAQLRQYQEGALVVQKASASVPLHSHQQQNAGLSSSSSSTTPQPSSQRAQQSALNTSHFLDASQQRSRDQQQQPRFSYPVQPEPLQLGGKSGNSLGGENWQGDQQNRPPYSQIIENNASGSVDGTSYVYAPIQRSASASASHFRPLANDGQNRVEYMNPSSAQMEAIGSHKHSQAEFPTVGREPTGMLGPSDLWIPNEGAGVSPGTHFLTDLQSQSSADTPNSADRASFSYGHGQWQAQQQLDQQNTYAAYANTLPSTNDHLANDQQKGNASGHASPAQGRYGSSQDHEQSRLYSQRTFDGHPQSPAYDKPQGQSGTTQAHALSSSYPSSLGGYLDSSHFSIPSRFYPTLHYNYGGPAVGAPLPNSAATTSDPSSLFDVNRVQASSVESASSGTFNRGQKRDRPSTSLNTHGKSLDSNESNRRDSLPSLWGTSASNASSSLESAAIADPAEAFRYQPSQSSEELFRSESHDGDIYSSTSVQSKLHQRSDKRPTAGKPQRHSRIPSLSRLKLEQSDHDNDDSGMDAGTPEPMQSALSAPPYYTATVFPLPKPQEPESSSRQQPSKAPRQAQRDSRKEEQARPGTSSSASDASLGSAPGMRRMYECKVCGRKFPRPSALTVHERIHSGEKPFNCDICNRPFTVASNLRRHQKIHAKQSRLDAGDSTSVVEAPASEGSTVKAPPALQLNMGLPTIAASDENESMLDEDDSIGDFDGTSVSSAQSFRSDRSSASISSNQEDSVRARSYGDFSAQQAPGQR